MAAQTLAEVVKIRMPRYAKCSPVDDIQVLTPMKKSPLGVEQLNLLLQNTLNPPSSHKREIDFRQNKLREGDKVMQIRNNYNVDVYKRQLQGQAVLQGGIAEFLLLSPFP